MGALDPLVDAGLIRAGRVPGGVTIGAPEVRGPQIPRVSVARSAVRAGYASDPWYGRGAHALALSGAYPRLVSQWEPHFVSDRELRAALRELLVVIEPAFSGVPVLVEGVAFPYLAFHEFVQLLLCWAVIVGVDVEAGRAVDIVDNCAFEEPEGHGDLLPALLARDFAGFFRLLDEHFSDPVLALMRDHLAPGRVQMFLAEARRFPSPPSSGGAEP